MATSTETTDSLLVFGVCQCRGVKFNEIPGVNVSYGTEADLQRLVNPHDTNCIGVFVGDLLLGHVAAEVSLYLCNLLALYRITW